MTLTQKSMLVVSAIILSFALYQWFHLRHQYEIKGNLGPMTGPLVLFDFDGVICDSFEVMLQSYNEIAVDNNLEPIDLSNTEQYRHYTSRQFVDYVGVSKTQLPKVVSQMRAKLSEKLEQTPPIESTLKLIAQLSQQKVAIGVVTSNSIENVERYLERYDLQVPFVIATGTFAKKQAFQSIIRKTKLKPDTIYYVGDETRDIEAAKPLGIETVSVTWGYHHKSLLEPLEPSYLVENGSDLTNLLLQITQA